MRTITNVQAPRIAELTDKLDGYPKRGVNAATGLPVGPDVFSDGAYGWSTNRAAVVNDAGVIKFVAATGETWLRANGLAPTLTPTERTEFLTLITPARRASSRWSVRAW